MRRFRHSSAVLKFLQSLVGASVLAGALSHSALAQVSVSASPATINPGGSSTVSWNSGGLSSCTYNGSPFPTSGSAVVSPPSTTTYTLVCQGGSGSATVTVVPIPPPSVSTSISPSSVYTGETATLSWSSSNATSCNYGGTSGSTTIGSYSSAGSYGFTVTCSGAGGSNSSTSTLYVSVYQDPPPTMSFSVTPSAIPLGGTATWAWTSANASYCSFEGTNFPTSGSLVGGPYNQVKNNQDYTASCYGAGGSVSKTIQFSVIPPPTATLSLGANEIVANSGTTTATWSSTNATSCSLGGGGASGTATVGPYSTTGTKTVTLTCSGIGGSVTQTAQVNVINPPPAQCSSYSSAPTYMLGQSNGIYYYRVVGTTGSGWGTDYYTDDSVISAMAVHAGVVPVGGEAIVRVEKYSGHGSFTGSTRNGITTSSWGSYYGSYSLSLHQSCGAVDTTPNQFTFVDKTNQAIGVEISSDLVTVNGFDGSLTATVSGDGSPTISKNGTTWATSLSVTSGNSLWVKLQTSASQVTRVATVSINGVSDTWSVTTAPPPASTCTGLPAAPSNMYGIANGTYYYMVTGASSGSGWGTGYYTADSYLPAMAVHAGLVGIGQIAAIRVEKTGSSSSYTGSTQNGITTSSYGPWIQTYTLAAHQCGVNPFSFTNVPAANPTTTITTSTPVTGNFNGTLAAQVTGGAGGPEISSDGQNWGTTAQIASNGTLHLRMLSSSTPLATRTATVTIGGVSASWSVTTVEPPPLQPNVINLSLSDSEITLGDPVSITWSADIPATNFPRIPFSGCGISSAWDMVPQGDRPSVNFGHSEGTGVITVSSPGVYEFAYFCNWQGHPELSDSDSVTLTVVAPPPPPPPVQLSAGFDEEYQARMGDFNADGLADIYIALDLAITDIPGVEGFYLIQDASHAFSLYGNLTPEQHALGEQAPLISSQVELIAADFDANGVLDLFLKNLSSEISGANDVMVFASNVAGEPPTGYVEADEEFVAFFTQLTSWFADPNYFTQTAAANGNYDIIDDSGFILAYWRLDYLVGIGYGAGEFGTAPFINNFDEVYDSEAEINGCGTGAFESDCFFQSGVWWKWHWAKESHIEYDFSGFNQDAIDLIQPAVVFDFFEPAIPGPLGRILEEGELVAGSADAQTLSLVLQNVLGVQFMGGVLDSPGYYLDHESDDPSIREKTRLDAFFLWLHYFVKSEIIEPQSPVVVTPSPLPDSSVSDSDKLQAIRDGFHKNEYIQDKIIVDASNPNRTVITIKVKPDVGGLEHLRIRFEKAVGAGWDNLVVKRPDGHEFEIQLEVEKQNLFEASNGIGDFDVVYDTAANARGYVSSNSTGATSVQLPSRNSQWNSDIVGTAIHEFGHILGLPDQYHETGVVNPNPGTWIPGQSAQIEDGFNNGIMGGGSEIRWHEAQVLAEQYGAAP